MAVNKPYGDNARVGAVRERSQTFRHKKQITYNSFFNNQIYNSISGENH